MRAVGVPGRWIWGVSGLVTAAAIAIPGTGLITRIGTPWHHVQPQSVATRTVTVSQPVTSVTVESNGAPVGIAAGAVRHVQVAEVISYDALPGNQSAVPQPAPGSGASAGNPAGLPAVTDSVSGGHLTLADPACENTDCSVSFTVITPPGVTVTVASQGGPVNLTGIAGGSVDSGGGPVSATRIGGPLTVTTDGGSLVLNGLTGMLRADTSGGPVAAQGVAAPTVTVSTGGGDARIVFAAAPDTVSVSTDGGPATLLVPGGPYALTADSDGGPQMVGIATDPSAGRLLTVTSGGGPLRIVPPAGS